MLLFAENEVQTKGALHHLDFDQAAALLHYSSPLAPLRWFGGELPGSLALATEVLSEKRESSACR